MTFDLSSWNDISSFVPENLLLDGKDAHSCRPCREDCILLNANNHFSPVAFRGSFFDCDGDFFSYVGVSPSDLALLPSELHAHPRMLLPTPSGSLLLLGDLMPTTGLLLVIRPHLPADCSAASLLSALSMIGETDFLPFPSVSLEASTSPFPDDALLEQMRGLFFYLNSFCTRYPFSSGLFTGSLRIARFVGCRLECGPLPFDEHHLDSEEQTRLAAFLLCVFLKLRRKIDQLCADLCADSELLFRYRVCAVSKSDALSSAFSNRETADIPDFLRLPCFRDFRFSVSDGSIRFDALLSQSPAFVNSVDPPLMCLSIVFDVGWKQ